MYKRNYHKWHNEKERIEDDKKRLFFHEREVWFCHMGANIGFEQDGKGEKFGRPVVVLKKFNNETCWAIPLTTKKKNGRYYFFIDLKDNIYRVANLSQLRLIDTKRLYQKLGTIREDVFKELKNSVISLLRRDK